MLFMYRTKSQLLYILIILQFAFKFIYVRQLPKIKSVRSNLSYLILLKLVWIYKFVAFIYCFIYGNHLKISFVYCDLIGLWFVIIRWVKNDKYWHKMITINSPNPLGVKSRAFYLDLISSFTWNVILGCTKKRKTSIKYKVVVKSSNKYKVCYCQY